MSAGQQSYAEYDLVMNQIQRAKAERFLSRHKEDGCFLMPNAWDPGSAKMLVASGFEAIGTTSAGIAFAHGKPDNLFCSPGARVERKTMIAEVRAICESVSVPVNADLEGGFGNTPEDVAQTILLAIKAGAVGGNIEDYTGIEASPLYDRTLAVERIAAARKVIDESGIPFVRPRVWRKQLRESICIGKRVLIACLHLVPVMPKQFVNSFRNWKAHLMWLWG